MSYKKAIHILPLELVESIQNHVDGEYIYIPRKKENKKTWGTNTSIRSELELRNSNIYKDFLSGMSVLLLSEKYYLSTKSIQRIILKAKRENE